MFLPLKLLRRKNKRRNKKTKISAGVFPKYFKIRKERRRVDELQQNVPQGIKQISHIRLRMVIWWEFGKYYPSARWLHSPKAILNQGCHIGEFIARLRNSGKFWMRLAKIFCFGDLANFWRLFESIWLQIFWFGDMYDLYICTYLLTYSYVDLLFLSLLMVWKFMTSNESVNVLKVEVWHRTLLLYIFAKCRNWLFRNICKMLITYMLSGKIQGER